MSCQNWLDHGLTKLIGSFGLTLQSNWALCIKIITFTVIICTHKPKWIWHYASPISLMMKLIGRKPFIVLSDFQYTSSICLLILICGSCYTSLRGSDFGTWCLFRLKSVLEIMGILHTVYTYTDVHHYLCTSFYITL